MSYHGNVPGRPAFPTTYAIATLPTVPPSPMARALANTEIARRENTALVKIIVGIIVGLIVMAILYWVWKQMQAEKRVTPNRRRPSKQSTREMARALYRRLEERGGVNDTTMRSLQQLGRR